ncbi:hypothetical protein LOS15_00200 [Halomonas sp. 7T]|uniref:pilus assembly PilX N-terminal domain-containing protein n=1 Tax=Halomonas sp. 7T TaxID=2893469 RepID=UPI0021DAE596|nr:pilus assembly PilX N-terminal domain-containing protein [Halomonas sp. 7T]UXZ54498.1 hypothetical protein LOS15_00200 [Halomonas sp. 7T]
MKKQQNGAALFVVMALLSASMVVGMSAMQSSLVDERLAGNFRSSVEAQMTAENTLSALVNPNNNSNRNDFLGQLVADPELLKETDGKLTGEAIAQLLQSGTLDQFIADLLPANFDELDEDEQRQIKEELLANLELQFEVDTEVQTVTITSWDRGLRNSAVRDSALVYRYEFEGANLSGILSNGIITCYGASFEGGGGVAVDSFDSQLGAYGLMGNSGGKASLVSLHENSLLKFNMGSAPGVTGDIFTAGSMEVTNTMPIDGDVYSVGEVTLKGNNALITGNIYSESSVFFQVGTRVDGNILVNTSVQVLGNWGDVNPLQPNGVYRGPTTYAIGGDVTSPEIYTEIGNRIEGDQSRSFPGIVFEDYLSEGLAVVSEGQACPDYSVEEVYNEYSFKSNPRNVSVLNWNGPEDSKVLGESQFIGGYEVFHVNSLTIGGEGLVIGKPTVIVADSNVSLVLWGDSAITLREGASLRIISKGKFDFNGSNVFEMNGFNPVVEVEGELVPAFSFISLYEGGGSAVAMNSDGDMYGEVLAPFGNVSISGSASLMGRVFSESLSVSGAGSIHYDRAYEDVAITSSAASPEWCSFNDLSPLTIASPVGQIRLPSSQAEFNGKGSVPDITVTQDDLDKFSGANAANNNIQGGIPDGLFNRGESAEKFHTFIEMLRTRNETVHVQGRSVKNNTSFGSEGNEQITFVTGTIDANNISGAGILVVKGDYAAGGNPDFNGLIIVLGDYSQKGGGGRDLNGALLVAPYDESLLEFTAADIEFRGGGSNNFNYDEAALRTAFSLLDSEEQASWGNCTVPPSSGDGELTWSLIDWR